MITFDIHRFASVTSTMDMCRALAEQRAPEGTVVVADEQTAGRGRVGHIWYSPPEQALYFSILLRPDLSPRKAGWITMIAALAVVDSLKVGRIEGLECHSNLQSFKRPNRSIKWFNDVLLNGKKVCGILVESSIIGERLDYAVLGIGLNVNTDFGAAPPDVRERATSLRHEFGTDFDRDKILAYVLSNFATRYERLLQTCISPADEYAQYLATIGRHVRLRAGDELIEGIALRVEDDGALLVLTSTGERAISFGHVL